MQRDLTTEQIDELAKDGAISVAQATQKYGASKGWLYGQMSEGRLAFFYVGRKRVISVRSLHDLLARGAASRSG